MEKIKSVSKNNLDSSIRFIKNKQQNNNEKF